MKKIYNEQGFLTKDGEKAIQPFKDEIQKFLKTASLEEFQVIECILKKIVGDTICDATTAHKVLVSKFNAMSDEEFEKYLHDTYSPIYGENWLIKASITSEEGDRAVTAFKKKLEKWEEEQKNRPREKNYGLKLSPRHKSNFRKILKKK